MHPLEKRTPWTQECEKTVATCKTCLENMSVSAHMFSVLTAVLKRSTVHCLEGPRPKAAARWQNVYNRATASVQPHVCTEATTCDVSSGSPNGFALEQLPMHALQPNVLSTKSCVCVSVCVFVVRVLVLRNLIVVLSFSVTLSFFEVRGAAH